MRDEPLASKVVYSLWSRERARRVLVATSLRPQCAVALRWANAIALRCAATLHVVHVLANEPTDWRMTNATRARVRSWVWREAALEIADDHVHLEWGRAERQIEGIASRAGADLIVLGAHDRALTARAVSRFMSRAVLVARGERKVNEVVIATDLEARGYPVVHCGMHLAAALRRQVTLVHNVAPGRASASRVADRKRELEEVAHGFLAINEVCVATKPSTAKALGEVAAKRDADIVVVGVRAKRGHTFARMLCDPSVRSVLAVPIAGASA